MDEEATVESRCNKEEYKDENENYRLAPGRTLSSKVREGRGRQAKDTSPEKNIKKSGLRDEKRSDESK